MTTRSEPVPPGVRLAHVLVRLHGPLADRAPSRAARLGVAEGAPVGMVWEALAALFPDVAAVRAHCVLARNGRWAEDGDVLLDGDEIDIVPPVSGG